MSNARENEAEAVRTTIVGGRPPGSGRSNVPVPRGIEVLVKKAAVDAEFRELLLAQRGKAAASIQLELDPAESAMLSAIPQEQLARIVDQTEVATELRPAFAGRVGAVMLAALGAGLVTTSMAKPGSVLPDPPRTAASAPEISTSANPTMLAQGGVVFGNVAQWPTNTPPAKPLRTNPPLLAFSIAGALPGSDMTVPPPTNPPPPVAVFGARVTPPTNPPPTNPPPAPPPGTVIRGLQPSRPPGIVAGATVPVPPLTNPPATNPPATNAVQPKAEVQPKYSVHVVAGAMIQVPPPRTPATNPPATNAVPPSEGGVQPGSPPAVPPPPPPPDLPPNLPITGTRPSRPPVVIAGVMIPVPPPKPPPTNPPTNPPPTNAVPPKPAQRLAPGVQPDHLQAGIRFLVPPPKAPELNVPDTNPPASKGE